MMPSLLFPFTVGSTSHEVVLLSHHRVRQPRFLAPLFRFLGPLDDLPRDLFQLLFDVNAWSRPLATHQPVVERVVRDSVTLPQEEQCLDLFRRRLDVQEVLVQCDRRLNL